jgi:hypothetical protein
VIKCAKRIHPKVGISYLGNKWQLMALLNFLEKECNKEEMEAPSHSGTKGNREVKNLECSINYDSRDGQTSRGM